MFKRSFLILQHNIAFYPSQYYPRTFLLIIIFSVISGKMWLEITICILIFVSVLILIYSFKYRKPGITSNTVNKQFEPHSVKVEAVDTDTKESSVLVDKIPPTKTGGIPKEKVEKHLKPGNLLRVYITDKANTTKHYTDHLIDHNCWERIKNLHIGMITTRFIGKSTDGLRMSTLADNAVQGHAWLMIHNLTEIPLHLNDDIVVEPHSTTRYLGYLHQGVTLGTILQDQDKIYPDFQYLNPHTNIYYGVVSDLKQPIKGPFQLEFSDDCDTDQTLWPFELGQM
jgi:hypothetical protein